MKLSVTLSDIERARQVLREVIDPTPLLYNRWLSEKLGASIYLKLENMQPIGSFKVRGATYKISQLTAKERKKGIIAASAGNHAQGVAWGAARYAARSTILMPFNAPLTKIQQTKALGAEVVLYGDSYDEAYTEARKYEKKTGAVFVHPYEDPYVIAGQGTVGLEILEQLPDIDVVVGSMGGGGLMAGVGLAMKSIRPAVEVVGVQAEGSRSLVESLRKGKIVETGKADTFADGIRVQSPSANMVRFMGKLVDRTFFADDEAIASAVLLLMEKAKIVSEGSGALPLAAFEQNRKLWKKKKVVLIISGGNIDVNVLSRIIDRGLVRAGRRVRLNVFIPDTPGSLNRLTATIASMGANILQAIHDRDTPKAKLRETMVEFTLETRGEEHCQELVRELKKFSQRVEVLH